MKMIWKRFVAVSFVIWVLLAACFLDVALSIWKPVERSTLFVKNDYEKIVLSHGGNTSFDRAFWGNSVLISAFREDLSDSGYANVGIVYGTMTDLEAMLEENYLTVNQDLVVMLNYFTLLDTMETNPTYPWHRGSLEPYCYFQRDRIQSFVMRTIDEVLLGQASNGLSRFSDLGRAVCYGSMTDEELEERIAVHEEAYWWQDLSYYQKNLKALEQVVAFCEEQGIRLRVVFAPWNNYIPMPEYPKEAMEAAREICKEQDIEVLDLTDAFSRDCFYDLGHFNYEYGAVRFTEEIDLWLNS